MAEGNKDQQVLTQQVMSACRQLLNSNIGFSTEQNALLEEAFHCARRTFVDASLAAASSAMNKPWRKPSHKIAAHYHQIVERRAPLVSDRRKFTDDELIAIDELVRTAIIDSSALEDLFITLATILTVGEEE